MLVVFSPIFVADTKIIFRYDFVAPLNQLSRSLKSLLRTFGTTLGDHLTLAASPNMFYITIYYKNKTNMKVAATNTNIEGHQLFSKRRILGGGFTIVQ